MVGGSSNTGQYNDTTFTKIFVGGLAWETQRDTMRSYFEQFGEILEAVVITDKNTGRSKGYGFVTFKDPDAAVRACQNPSPVIDEEGQTAILHHLNYYGVYGGQQFSPFYSPGASGTPGMFHNFYPLYTQYGQSSQGHGFGVQYPHMVQYPYLPQHYSSTGILSIPSSMAMETTTAGNSSNQFSKFNHVSPIYA
ncbi:hypothetical protein GH714_021798 [Hevea brasiliensis]|uniref:RRM domain-containing protein n=1 Tax=Hevea brasiliensis TaxID=3981 RepID=A0A6A6NIJ5_HEVBR|nr:hypothetical protein GH714_021798 [Hevea brasiliensis]